jgi:hypothetical protein
MEADMDSVSKALGVVLIGVVVAALGFRARSPHRLSLVSLGGALVAGPMAPLFTEPRLQRTLSIIAIVLALVAIANSARILVGRVGEIRGHG